MFIVSIAFDILWETLVLLGLLCLVSVQTCILVWHWSIWGRMPLLWPPWVARNWTLGLRLKDPCPTHCTTAHVHCTLLLLINIYFRRVVLGLQGLYFSSGSHPRLTNNDYPSRFLQLIFKNCVVYLCMYIVLNTCRLLRFHSHASAHKLQ